MDRKSWLVILVCALLIVLWGPLVNHIWPPKPAPLLPTTSHQTNAVPQLSQAITTSQPPPTVTSTSIVDYQEAPSLAKLENDFVAYDIVAEGAGIRQAILKKHNAPGDKRVTLNAWGEGPILQLWHSTTNPDFKKATLLVSSSNQISLETELQPGLKLRKEIILLKDYDAKVQLNFLNSTPNPITLTNYYINCGTAAPLHGSDLPLYIGWDWFDGSTSSHQKITAFAKGSFLFFTFREPRSVVEETRSLQWLTSRNQFFVTLLQPEGLPFQGYRAEEKIISKFQPPSDKIHKGAQVWGLLPHFEVPASGEKSLTLELYTGPRKYGLLKQLGNQKQLVMDFGFWSWVSVPLLNTMNFLYGFVHNYGVAIILMVLLIRTLFWPLQAKANRTMKQMQVLTPKLKELQEKYKDQPQKIQIETMGMYRTYGINPVGGCLPMLVQIPVFFGFYAMLQSAIELRNAPFLWISDLSQPDTIAHFFGFPFNPLPLVMGATSLWQSNIMPYAGMDKGQATLMKFMPLMFVIFCYNFSSALALYWTMQNLIGVYQTYHNLAKPAPQLEKKSKPKSRWQAMMEMAKHQAEAQKKNRKK